MLTFADAVRAVDHFFQPVEPGTAAPTAPSPVAFDRALVPRLMALHEALNARFAHLVCALDNDAREAEAAASACVEQLHELRRIETVSLYPVIGRGIDADAAARSQLMQVRMVLLAQCRQLLRRFEELLQAIRNGRQARELAENISQPLADYLRRCEFEIYPLYALVDGRISRFAMRAA
jgi:hypothetical protein